MAIGYEIVQRYAVTDAEGEIVVAFPLDELGKAEAQKAADWLNNGGSLDALLLFGTVYGWARMRRATEDDH